jgi:hypothetical protein
MRCKKCHSEFSSYTTIDGKSRNLCKRKFCLSCSPFGKRNRRDLVRNNDTSRECSWCKKRKSLRDFYKPYGKRKRQHTFCKDCQREKNRDKFRDFKQKCAIYKGGKCKECGYNKCIAAFEFHHLDPTKKDFSISRVKARIFDEDIKRELDKCELLCANCHREKHWLEIG